ESLMVLAAPDEGVVERRIIVKPVPASQNDGSGNEALELRLDFAGRTAPDEIMVFIPLGLLGGEECWIPTPGDHVLRLARDSDYAMLQEVLVVDRSGGHAGLWRLPENPGETLERLQLNI